MHGIHADYQPSSLSKMWAIWSVALVASGAFSAGCTRDSRVNVQGIVEVDGKRVADGVISFWPADGHGVSVQAMVLDGQYRVALPPGEKVVGVESFDDAGERPIMGESGPRLRTRENVLPQMYADQRRSPLRCLVDDGSRTHNVHITCDAEP